MNPGNDRCILSLRSPVCTSLGACIAISRKMEKRFRLIGNATIMKGERVRCTETSV
jgi:translation initiation factor 2 gamma subunit (eIF-2gamma)